MSPSVTIPIGRSFFVITTLPACDAVIFSDICLIVSSGAAVITGLFITSRTRTRVLTGVEYFEGVVFSRLSCQRSGDCKLLMVLFFRDELVRSGRESTHY